MDDKRRIQQVCYVVVCEGWDLHSQMAWVSACSVRRHEPNLHITVIIDGPQQAGIAAASQKLSEVADSVRHIPSGLADMTSASRYLKITARHHLEGDLLYLDSDTLAMAPFREVFDIRGDVAAATDFNVDRAEGWCPPRLSSAFRDLGWEFPLPYYLNAGVFVMPDTQAARALSDEWLRRWRLMSEHGKPLDQPAFNSALFALDVEHEILHNQYNSMLAYLGNWREAPPTLPKLSSRRAKILHFFGGVKAEGGTLFEHLLAHVARTGEFDDAAYSTAIRKGHPWGPQPEAWQLLKSGNYVQACRAKLRKVVRQLIPMSS